MPLEITRRGYIEVWKGDEYISRHVSEWEAIESLSKQGDGDYEIRFPLIVAKSYGVLPPGGDTQAPTTPGSVQAVALNATSIRITWTESTDDIAVAGYQVFRGGAPLNTTTNLTFDDTGLTPSTQYSYTVTAFDAAGNNSVAGGPALATTNANSAPVWALGNQAYVTGAGVNISLDSVCTDADADTITYSLVSGALPSGLALSGARNQTLSGTVDMVEVANFTLGASDGIAAVQNVALTFTITAPDLVAPSAPIGLAVTNTTSSSITLDWTDNVETDLNHYDVYRSTVSASGPWGKRNNSDVLVSTYQDTGLSGSTDYWYYVTATDDSDNESTGSSVVNQTTLSSSLAASDDMIVSLLASRRSGPAPLGVQFDAVDTTHNNGSVDTFRDIGYYFHYGDERGETWPNSAVAGHSKNIDYGGPLGAHVFEVPGTYDVRVRARDPFGEIEDAQVIITVQDPDVVYAGTLTICISTGTDFTGAPSGAQQLASQTSWPTIQSNRRYLLRAGDDFQSFGILAVGQGINDVQIGSFGAGNKPLIDNMTVGQKAGTPGTLTLRNTFYDLELTDGVSTGATAVPQVGDQVQHALFHRLAASSQGAKFYFDGTLNSGSWSGDIALVQQQLYNIVSECEWILPRQSTSNGVYAFHATGGRLAIIGGEFSGTDGPISGDGSHNIRLITHYRTLVQHVRMYYADSDSHNITARAAGTDAWSDFRWPGGDGSYAPESKYIVIRKNRVSITGEKSNRLVSVEPTNASANALITKVIVENNYRVGTTDPTAAGGEFINGAGDTVTRGNSTETGVWTDNTSTHLTTILGSYPNLQDDNDSGLPSITTESPR